jgi:hypothetical protein
MPEMSENSGKLSINTITRQTREWRCMVLVELYFNTLGKLTHSTANVGVYFFLCILTILSELYKLHSIISLSDTVILKIWKEVTMASLKVVYQYWLGETKENHGNSHNNWPLAPD